MKKIVVLVALFGIYFNAFSQDEDIKIEDLYVDFAIPDISSFSLLGIEEDKISRPGNINKLAVQLKELVPFNTITPGVAVEFSPWLLIKKEVKGSSNLDQYRKPLQGLQFNFATANDSVGSHVGLGARWVIFDDADPLKNQNLEKEILSLVEDLDPTSVVTKANNYDRKVISFRESLCKSHHVTDRTGIVAIDEYLKNYLASPGPKDELLNDNATLIDIQDSLSINYSISLTPNEKDQLKQLIIEYNRIIMSYVDRDGLIESYSKKVKEFKEKWLEEQWNAKAAHIAVGTAWNSPDTTWGNLSKDVFTAFGGLSWPLQFSASDKIKGQAILQTLWRKSYDDSKVEESYFSIGSRVLFGNSERRISAEYLFSRSNNRDQIDGMPTMMEDIKVYRGTLGWEMKVAKGTWFELAGGYRKVEGQGAEITSFSTIKYAFNGKSRFDTK
ncbi:MAG: hypothetical protein ABJO02_17000 [Reichenbachiella sp.]|uniref:hypothetical protein n=1 Tax=Reichenbachiella sp. TaxID=2184521 RepID=UPI003298CA1F